MIQMQLQMPDPMEEKQPGLAQLPWVPVVPFLSRDWSCDLVAQRVVASLMQAMWSRLEADHAPSEAERQELLGDALWELREAAKVYNAQVAPLDGGRNRR